MMVVATWRHLSQARCVGGQARSTARAACSPKPQGCRGNMAGRKCGARARAQKREAILISIADVCSMLVKAMGVLWRHCGASAVCACAEAGGHPDAHRG